MALEAVVVFTAGGEVEMEKGDGALLLGFFGLGVDDGVWRCSWEEEKARLGSVGGDAQSVEQAKEAAKWAQDEGDKAGVRGINFT
uniref:Uncharacterized protein n=1 Tax=Oryza glumipatula TaxID=40148 RepID=A0A0D9ZIR5_9ORYZ